MTDIAITERKTTLPEAIRAAVIRLKTWLNEDVYCDPVRSEFAPRDWADMPVHHPADERHSR